MRFVVWMRSWPGSLSIWTLALLGLAAAAPVASVAAAAARQTAPAKPLTVVAAGPAGELDGIAEANEVRVTFSEPMVVLGRIPQPVTAPFFKIAPAVGGTFRWSGTTILIFTPAKDARLPHATRYQVTIDPSATAISGRKLAQPYTFQFTTPTVKLRSTAWARKNGRRFDSPLVIALHFNQPVRPADVAAHTTLRFEQHDFVAPEQDAGEQARLRATDPQAIARFEAKVADTRRTASATTPVTFQLAKTWDKDRFKPSPELVVLEATATVPPESWVRVELDGKLPAIGGAETPGKTQDYVVKVEPAFFIDGHWCDDECDPERWNPLRLRRGVRLEDLRARLTLTDITTPAKEVPIKPAGPRPTRSFVVDSGQHSATLEDLGYAPQPPARTFAYQVDATLQADDGQTLGYPYLGIVENWHRQAFTSFGDGHGVWEADGGALLPFYSRNFTTVTQWAAPLSTRDLMPTMLRLQNQGFHETPDTSGTERKLGVTADRIQSHGLNISGGLNSASRGVVWAAVQEGTPIAKAHTYGDNRTRTTLVQVTNLGITVKDSPQNTLIFVTRLDNAAPVDGATVSIVNTKNETFWTGKTNADGIALAPNTRLRDPRKTWQFAFVVTAEKDGDVAYVGSDWQEGVQPWEFGNYTDLTQADPMLRGSVFSDRGVYKLGEEIHLKAILRHDTANGIKLLADGTPVEVTVRDSQSRDVDKRTVKVNAWSSAEWTVRLPAEGSLGSYSLTAKVSRETPKPAQPQPTVTNVAVRSGGNDREEGDGDGSPDNDSSYESHNVVYGSFLVAAYRRPEFRVDATLSGVTAIAGTTLKGVITGRYLFGAAMTGQPVSWNLTRSASTWAAISGIRKKFVDERFTFLNCCGGDNGGVASEEAKLDAKGTHTIESGVPISIGLPYTYSLEGEVEDLSRQKIAGRASFLVHPAPWYIGLLSPSSFVDQRKGFATEVITVTPDGVVTPGVSVELKLFQRQWHSVRQAEGNGFYAWDTTEKQVEMGSWNITTTDKPVPLPIALTSGGSFILKATATDGEGRTTTTELDFYALGEGYTAWRRYDHQRIDLLPEKTLYKPGDTARILIKSPWEQATALITTEREGIRSQRRFALTSTMQTVEVPINEADIPNVYVSVLLVKGRTKVTAPPAAADGDKSATKKPEPTNVAAAEEAADPGKPAFRLGYVQLQVEDASKKLAVKVKANKEEYRPAGKANVEVEVVDAAGKGAQSEVTLWAVDYGVLSLTDFKTPNVLKSVYVNKLLQVFTTDNRQRVVSRRVLTPKGADEGGGGGEDSGVSSVRKDFRVLAFWLGSVVTDGKGRAKTSITLPESLTTYRIMAVSGDKLSRFGGGESEIRINKPVLMRAAFPRFLALGDTAYFGSVITNQLKEPGTAIVTMRSLDPGVLEIKDDPQQQVQVNAGGSAEVRFNIAARAVGRARVQMSVRLRDESDAFEEVLPVEILSTPETVAAYGEAKPDGREAINVPTGVVPTVGGLHLELSSTAMVGLGEGARYLVEYPYGCAEQRGSRALALLLAADLGEAFSLPGIAPKDLKARVQTALEELRKYQCPDGGFAYWPGACWTRSPYLTAYLLHVFQVADKMQYTVDKQMMERAYTYLERELSAEPDVNEGWWPSYTAWQSFAVKVLVEGGRQQDSHINRLYGYLDRMPIFGMAYLYDAMTAKGEKGARVEDLRRRIMNGVLPEGGSAHVEELSDPHLLWFWNSNIRSTGIVLGSLVRNSGDPAFIRQFVRWLMTVRKNGRWGNTQENAIAMEALVAYYRKYESEIPDFTGVVTMGPNELAREKFAGRSATAIVRDIPMKELSTKSAPGVQNDLTFNRQGTGTLFYTARLKYAVDAPVHDTMDNGFRIERRYARMSQNDQVGEPSTSFKAGDLVQVTLEFQLTKERRFVAVTDPLPAGFEPVESWFNTTASTLSSRQDRHDDEDGSGDTRGWRAWWERGGFDHVERHDNRVLLFATRLSEGKHTFSYIVRATTAGTFRTAPAHAEEMYEPEVFGRTASVTVEVAK
jgi:uncharacterized protein YfaS (alpha-2-macroglobulin family)